MPKQHWIVKSEPESYPWSALVADGRTAWTGIRNFQSRNNLRAMKAGDAVLFYHSVTEKSVVGLAKVVREAYADPTAEEGDWSCVDLAPLKPLKRAVSLDQLKVDPATKDILLVRHSRLSVTPVTEPQFARIMELAATKA